MTLRAFFPIWISAAGSGILTTETVLFCRSMTWSPIANACLPWLLLIRWAVCLDLCSCPVNVFKHSIEPLNVRRSDTNRGLYESKDSRGRSGRSYLFTCWLAMSVDRANALSKGLNPILITLSCSTDSTIPFLRVTCRTFPKKSRPNGWNSSGIVLAIDFL